MLLVKVAGANRRREMRLQKVWQAQERIEETDDILTEVAFVDLL